MDGKDEIAEVRGVAKDQNIEDLMLDITEKKLDEFPDKKDYQKKVYDMKYLTLIDKKVKQNQELTKEELIFLYEIKSKIKGFGWETDPRIEVIKSKRNTKKDYAIIFDCKEENIATSMSDFEKNDIEVCIGDLNWNENLVPAKFKNLRVIIGKASFKNLESAQGLENLQFIKDYADFESLTNAQGLENLQSIGESAHFNSLINAQGLENLKCRKWISNIPAPQLNEYTEGKKI